jgi:hypothetical protein
MKRPNKKIKRYAGGGEFTMPYELTSAGLDNELSNQSVQMNKLSEKGNGIGGFDPMSMAVQQLSGVTNQVGGLVGSAIGKATTNASGVQSGIGAFGQGFAEKGFGVQGLIGGVSNLIGLKKKNKEAVALERQQELMRTQPMRNQINANIQQGLVPNQAVFKCGGKSKRKMKYPGGSGSTPSPQITPLPKLGDIAGLDTTKTNEILNNDRIAMYNYPSANDPELLKKYSDPQQVGRASTIFAESKNPQVRKDFLSGWNTTYGKNNSYLYDPEARGLAPLQSDDPRPSVQKRYGELYNQYFPTQQTQSKRLMGGSAVGSYAKGGYAVDDRGFANSELEDNEVYRTPKGTIYQVNGRTHAEGGEQFNLPQGTEILGKNIVPGTNKSYKDFGDKLMKDYNKFTKILSEKHTPLAKKTATMMLDKTQKQFSELMQHQESMKGSHQMPDGSMMRNEDMNTQYARGGVKRYDVGNTTEDPQITPQDWMYNSSSWRNKLDPTNPEFTNLGSNKMSTDPDSKQPFEWQDALTEAGTLAPIAYNLSQGLFGKAQKLDPKQFYNPNENQSMNLMRSRRYNANPELENNRLQQSTYLRNLRQGAASQSQYLGGLQAGSTMKQRADAETYARKQNTDNQYIGQEAEMLGNFGAQRAQTNLTIQDINDRNASAKKSYIPTALSQLQQYSQNARMTKNLKGRDAQLMDIYKKMFRGYSFAKN